ncbi:MAG: LysR family transcriptional regulator [Acidimicrobiales bacterium]
MNDLLGVRLTQLAYLDAVGRHGHFQAAADELLVSQSAISQGLQRLEVSVGAPLFERDGRGHRLTPAGETTLVFARRVLSEADHLGEQLEQRRSGSGGRVRLGMVDAAALYLLNDQLRGFRERRPEVDVRVTVETSGRLLELLDQFELDVAVIVGPPPNDDAIEVAREPLYVYGPPIDDLTAATSWVLYPAQSRTRHFIDRALATLDVPVTVRSESSNPSVIAQLVRLGEGWTVLPSGIAETIADPLPRRSEAIAERPMYAVRREQAPSDPLVEGLIEALMTLPH